MQQASSPTPIEPLGVREAAIDAVLAFWFGPGMDQRWFVKDAVFDELVKATLGAAHAAAVAGRLAAWADSPRGCLVLVLLLDQVPRNLYRDDPRAFASDAQARQVTQRALQRGDDAALSQVERCFLYLPLEHSEALADQKRCCALMAGLDENPGWFDYAVRHRDIIARFGRFPHRNAVLGRASTPDEVELLKDPDASF